MFDAHLWCRSSTYIQPDTFSVNYVSSSTLPVPAGEHYFDENYFKILIKHTKGTLRKFFYGGEMFLLNKSSH